MPMNWGEKEPEGKQVERVSTGRKVELLIQPFFFLPLASLKFSLANCTYTLFLIPPHQK